MQKTVQMDVTAKTAEAPVQYIWYPADAACGPALEALSARLGLARLHRPLEAGRGPALLLYTLPERCLYQAFLQDQPPEAALAAWSAQAREILQALQDGGPQVAAAELGRFLRSPAEVLAGSGQACAAAPENLAPPHPLPAEDPVLLALAAACLPQDGTIPGLARALQDAALPHPDPDADAPPGPDPAAAAQAYQAASAQIAWLQEQKNLMHHELETLQSLNRSLAEALQQKIAGKEQALQAAGREIRALAARSGRLQQQLDESRAQAATPSRQLKPRLLRLIAPLRPPRRSPTGRSKA